jgi:hypothetical protein
VGLNLSAGKLTVAADAFGTDSRLHLRRVDFRGRPVEVTEQKTSLVS